MHLCVIPAHWVVEVKYNNTKKLPSSGREKRFFLLVCVWDSVFEMKYN